MDVEFEIIQKQEYELVSKEVRSNPVRLSQLLHDKFEEFGKSGRCFNKADIVNDIPTSEYSKIELANFKFVRLSPKTVLVKYQSLSNGVNANRSSIWVKDEKNWQMIFHQGTKC